MAVSISIFFIIILIFIFSVIGSWLYIYHSFKNVILSFNNLDESLVKKYKLLNYCIVDKKRTWIDISIWITTLYLIDHLLLLFPFLIFQNKNQSLFIASITLVVLGNLVCLIINFVIAFFVWKKVYLSNKEKIEININEFKIKMNSYKYVEVDQFIKTDIYNFRDKIYQKYLNKSLSKLEFKSNDQWLIQHYIIFLKYSHYFIFNLTKSDIKYSSDFNTTCDQILNNLMFKINNNFVH